MVLPQNKISVVFFGSGPVAAKSLSNLLEYLHIEAVITRPRAAHHKGSVPVIELCEKHLLPFHTPNSKLELTKLLQTTRFSSSLGIVIDYGIIINQDVIDSFTLGIINSHFSLLPEWRGADPITFAILSGQGKTGVSLMLINDKMDEGPILSQADYDLPADISAPQLTDDLIDLSDQTLKAIIPLYVAGEILAVPQAELSLDHSKKPSYSRKLTKSDGVIDWAKPAAQLESEIRAYIDWPRSRTNLAGIEVIITKAHVVDNLSGGNPGEMVVIDKKILVYTGAGSLAIDRLKPVGKTDMLAAAFLAGYGSRLAS